ncbi:MAG: type IV secretory system conjugative DNA transfer family protein, partial [Parvularcula sp.]|nr:type IV secretory system conjugative DNA transfer family protein [Parvularcula sp.]
CVIIPNLKRWPHNALVIDPKGEAAAATWEAREAMGQAVHVLDPFGRANVPDRLQARVNPLDAIDPTARTVREDIKALADGLVIPSGDNARHWDEGSLDVVAGFIALVASSAPPENRSLVEVRHLLSGPDIGEAIDAMNGNRVCGGLMNAAAGRLLRTGNEAQHFLSGANANTAWLDSEPMQDVLSNSTFQLADLKAAPCTVFLVLPPEELHEHGRFLRLFVRTALRTMAKGGDTGRQCLFLLDEFFSLGRIDEIAKAAGLMPGYGVQLWPILQDLSQLVALYGRDGAGETFFGNADLHQFFGNTDKPTLEYVSTGLGVTDMSEIPMPPAAPVGFSSGTGRAVGSALSGKSRGSQMAGGMLGGAVSAVGAAARALEQSAYQDEMAQYQREMAKHGRPRLTVDEVAQIVQKKADVVADHMICFVHGRERVLLKPAPHFRALPGQAANAPRSSSMAGKMFMYPVAIFTGFILGGTFGAMATGRNEVLSFIFAIAGAVGLVWLNWKADQTKARRAKEAAKAD